MSQPLSHTSFPLDTSQIRKLQSQYSQAYSQIKDILFQYEGVKALGIGAREKEGVILPEICFRVYVNEKKPLSDLLPKEVIPSKLKGYSTDILAFSSYQKFLHTTEYDVVKGGILIKNENHENSQPEGAATLGCIARRVSDDKLVALTCLHVISDGRSSATETGYDVGHPHRTTCCCCCHGNVIGEVVAVDEDTDSAIIELNRESRNDLNTPNLENTIRIMGTVSGVREATCFDEVEKVGVGSGHTFGVIVDVQYDGDKILVSPGMEAFAAPGDSGSVIVHKDSKEVVGLLVGGLPGAETAGVGIHIGPIMAALNIKIAGEEVGSLGVPSSNCDGGASTAISNAQNWLDKYDNTSVSFLVLGDPSLSIPPNTTDFSSDVERQDRTDAVNNVLFNMLVERRDNRRDQAIDHDAVLDHPELPYHSSPVGSSEEAENERFEDLEHLAEYQENLYKQYFPEGQNGTDFVKLREAFELFANGNARTYPPAANADITLRLRAGALGSGDPQGGLREPNGDFILMFAEFSLLCIENANNTQKPNNLINEEFWLNVARFTIGMQELYMHVYRSDTQSVPPPVQKIGEGLYETGATVRNFDREILPGDFKPKFFNMNNSGGGQLAQLSASSSIGQSDQERRVRIRHKYMNLTFDELKLAFKENIQQMLRMP